MQLTDDQPTLTPDAPWRSAIDWRAKGFPVLQAPVAAVDVAAQGWNLFDGRFLMPTMALHEGALQHNIQLVADYCAGRGVSLAPHGKTTMSPDIFGRQLAAGAWAMTVATVWQARVAATVGVRRILIANEVTDPASIEWIGSTLDAIGPEVYCWVESLDGVEMLGRRLGDRVRRLPVLVEVGTPGGRAGVRTFEAALEVAACVAATPSLRLAGVACFEGTVSGETEADRLVALQQLLDLVRRVAVAIAPVVAAGGATEMLLTGGGSQYLMEVADGLMVPLGMRLPVRCVLRSGGTVVHDQGGLDLVSPFGSVRAAGGPRLVPALEVWGPVLSMPEPGLAIVGAGKRDLPHDGAPPLVVGVRDTAGSIRRIEDDLDLSVRRLNDQHAYLSVGDGEPLGIGDLVAFGVRHPCMAFDRWRWLPVVDADYAVIDAYELVF